jgi:Kazal-type serine protease inhibitor domain
MNEKEVTQAVFIDKFLSPNRNLHPQGDQVCGKNNITYHSWCHLMKDSCNTGFFIDIKHEGPCLASS